MKLKSAALYLLKFIALVAVYRLGVVVGLSMAYVQPNASPVWPPTGIAMAGLLLFGWSLWPAVTLAVFIGSIITGAPIALSAGMAVGNTLEALAIVYVLTRLLPFRPSLDRILDVVGLIAAAISCTMISATIGSLSLLLINRALGPDFWQIWATWWIGDFLGALVVGPLLLVWISAWRNRLPFHRPYESAAVLITLAGVTTYVFHTPQAAGIVHKALLYVIFPFVIWAALRTGQRGATAAIALISGIAIWGTAQGYGPFAETSKNDSLILLQTFMAVVAVISLILAAATAERQSATAALNHRVRDLLTLNRSSETLLSTLGQQDLYNSICQLARSQFDVDVAWIEMAEGHREMLRPVAVSGASFDQLADLKGHWQEEAKTAAGGLPWVRMDGSGKDYGGDKYPSFAVYPLLSGDLPLAYLKLLSRRRNFFDHDRQILLQSFSNLSAIAIQNALLLERVRKGNEQLHALSQRLMKAQEEERLHLSRELHDESGQLLSAILVQLGLLERNAANNESLQAYIKELKQNVNTIQQNLHTLAVNLRPASLDHLGLISALEQYIKDFQHRYGIKIEFESTGMQERRLPPNIETAIFRIVQESLTNVIMHAQASRVDVVISRKNDTVAAIIEDNGVGFFPSLAMNGEHLGLFGMRERIEMLGGTLAIESEPGQGTIVKAEVPCHD